MIDLHDPKAWDVIFTTYIKPTLCINCENVQVGHVGRCNACWATEANNIMQRIDDLAREFSLTPQEAHAVVLAVGFGTIEHMPRIQNTAERHYAEHQEKLRERDATLPLGSYFKLSETLSYPLPTSQEVGRLIQERRERAGLSRAALAVRTDLSETTIKKMEECERLPTRRTALKLSAVPELGLDPTNILPPLPSDLAYAQHLISYLANAGRAERVLRERLKMAKEEHERERAEWQKTTGELAKTKQTLRQAELRLQKATQEKLARRSSSGIAEEYVYFILNEDNGTIKIGYSSNPGKRLASLRVGNSSDLRIIGRVVGGAEIEAQFHRRFGSLRVSREWFRYEGELAEYIATLASAAERVA